MRVSEMPVPLGDMGSEQWIYRNLLYTVLSRDRNEEGHCVLHFTLDANGQMAAP